MKEEQQYDHESVVFIPKKQGNHCLPNKIIGYMEYLFIDITPRFTVTQIGSTCYSPLYESNRTILSFTILNTWNHLPVCKQMINIK